MDRNPSDTNLKVSMDVAFNENEEPRESENFTNFPLRGRILKFHCNHPSTQAFHDYNRTSTVFTVKL